MATALFLNASSSYPNQTKLHSINRRRIIIPIAPQISLPKKIIPATAGFITTNRRSSSSSSRVSSFRVQCFIKEEVEKERKPNQNPFEKFAKELPVYQIISIVLLMVSRSPIVIGVLLLLDLCLIISSFSSHSLEKNGGEVVLDIGVVLGLILFLPVMFLLVYYRARHPKRKSTVIKVQVGLLGLTPSLQKDLTAIRNWSKIVPDLFDSVVDRWIILPVITSSLANHLDCCMSAYSSVDVKPSIKEGEEQLNKLLTEERQKFDEKTPVNVIGTKRQSSTSNIANGFTNEYTVITILLAAIGVHELPAINDIADLKEALQKLGSIPRAENMAVEVLWTSQNENGTLPERELLEHYPLLRHL